MEATSSIWHRTAQPRDYPALDTDLETDTLIIGGGITGVTCAYRLACDKKEAVLIEAGTLCCGTTGNTTGKVTVQHDLVYSRLAKEKGWQTARIYADAQQAALDFVKTAVEKEGIDCELTFNSACIYAENEQEHEALLREYEQAKALSIAAELETRPAFPDFAFSLLRFSDQAVFHPIRYIEGLARAAEKKGAKIFCRTKAVSVRDGEPVTVTCENGVTIRARRLVMATQYPIFDGPFGFYFTRLYPMRSYGIAVRPKRDFPGGSYISAGEPARSVRTFCSDGARLLIVVGDGHPTARDGEDSRVHFDNLEQFAGQIAGVDEVVARWSAQDYDTPDGLPYIGRLHANSAVLIAAGFKKWGMTNGTLAGIMTADIIARGGSRFEELFSPARADISGSLGNFLTEAAGWIFEFLKSKLESDDAITGMRPGEGRIIHFKGKKAGVYLDEFGFVTIVDIACTHMTTSLNFNEAEKTWDCPAHGGRFAFDGRLIEGPPKDPLKLLFRGRYDELTVRLHD